MQNRCKRIVVAITGASGVIYGIQILKQLRKTDFEIHLIVTNSAKKIISLETDYSVQQVQSLADMAYSIEDIDAPLASGSFLTDAMVVAPCTIGTLSGIANSRSDNLLLRAADVMLKEKKKLVLMVRETPLHRGHLKLMDMAASLGAHIVPPIPAFYHHPKSIEDIIDHSIGKVFDYLGIEHTLFQRWGERY